MHYSNEKSLTLLFTVHWYGHGRWTTAIVVHIFSFLFYCYFCFQAPVTYSTYWHTVHCNFGRMKNVCSQIYPISGAMLDKDKFAFCFTYIARRLIWFHISHWSAVNAHFSLISRCSFPFQSDSYVLMFHPYHWTTCIIFITHFNLQASITIMTKIESIRFLFSSCHSYRVTFNRSIQSSAELSNVYCTLYIVRASVYRFPLSPILM